MRKMFILYNSFYDRDGKEFRIGGIQTYIRNLLLVAEEAQYTPVIVQFGSKFFHRKFNGTVDVYGIDVSRERTLRRKVKALLKFVKDEYSQNDVILFATDSLYTPTSYDKVIAIQHGIYWDVPSNSSRTKLFEIIFKAIKGFLRINRLRGLQHLVCVDNNYINWLRTQSSFINMKLYYIPNSVYCGEETDVNDMSAHSGGDKPIRIVFARRFERYRGTRLFANAIEDLLKKHENIEVTFAGSGPDEEYLKERFIGFHRVKFTTYSSEKSIDFHRGFDIVVVPSLGSEGTSYSLLEAMVAGCAVVATNVGGMTNIVLDNYNGLLIAPEEQELYAALSKLIDDDSLRNKLSNNAYTSVNQAFSMELWIQKWKKVLEEV